MVFRELGKMYSALGMFLQICEGPDSKGADTFVHADGDAQMHAYGSEGHACQFIIPQVF